MMTDHYAVIGNPISHTKSPLIHGLFAQAAQQDMQYTAIEGPLEPDTAFADVVRTFAAGGGKGMKLVERAEDFAAGLASAQRECLYDNHPLDKSVQRKEITRVLEANK